ncbi:MAG: three component ABC system middle component [Chthoniobacteraceae bacterium]
MSQVTEYELVQNPVLGSISIWAFIVQYWKDSNRAKGVPLAVLPVVLPVTFHSETAKFLARRRFNGGLLNALAEDRCFPIGLQHRMEEMFDQTCEAINVGLAAKLFSMDRSGFTFVPKRLSRPTFADTTMPGEMFATAERLGHWFAIYPHEQICGYLQIVF